MPRKPKIVYEVPYIKFKTPAANMLLFRNWYAWNAWDLESTTKEIQAYFDSNVGNIYKNWHSGDKSFLKGNHMLISCKVARKYYYLTLLSMTDNTCTTHTMSQDIFFSAELVSRVEG